MPGPPQVPELEMLHLEQRLGARMRAHPWSRGAHLPPEHRREQLRLRQRLRVRAADLATIPQHRDPIRDAVDLLHLVGDVDHAAALRAQPRDVAEEPLGVLVVEGARGFVHHEDPRALGERLRDLDQLLHRECQSLDETPRIEGLQPDGSELLPGRSSLRALIDAEAPGPLAPKEEVVLDGQRRHERKLLMDRRDPGGQAPRADRSRSGTAAGHPHPPVRCSRFRACAHRRAP